MNGTPKQIEQATRIRAEKVIQLQELVGKASDRGIPSEATPLLVGLRANVDDAIGWLALADVLEGLGLGRQAQQYRATAGVLQKDDAKWWIDNQTQLIAGLMRIVLTEKS